MGGKSSGSSAPDFPDPEKVIHAQGIENIRGGLATTALNRYNVNTPYGTVKWTRTPAINYTPAGGTGTTGGTGATGVGSHADQDVLRGVSEGAGNNWGPNSGGTMMGVYNINDNRWDWGGAVHDDGSYVGLGSHPQYSADPSWYDNQHYYMQPMGGGNYGYYYKGQQREAQPTGDLTYTDLWSGNARMAALDPNSPEARYMAANGGGVSGGTGRFAARQAGPDVPSIYAGDGTISNIGGVGVGVGGTGIAMSPLDQWTQTIELNPEEQRILDLSRAQKIAGGEGVIDAVGRMNNDTFFDGGAGSFSAGGPINRGAIANTIGFNESGARSRIEQAMYDRYKSRLDPRFSEAETRLNEKLVNMGQARGGELWNEEQARLGRERTDAYDTATTSSILAGEQALQSEFGRTAAEAQFANQAQQQDYAQQLGISQRELQLRQQANSERLQQYAALSQAMAGQPLNGAPSQIAPPAASIGAVDAAGIYNADTMARLKQYQLDQASSSDMMGNLISAGGTIGAAAMKCWVAREVFGMNSLDWVRFRVWLMDEAPARLRSLYLTHGEKLASEIANDADAKAEIRAGMEMVLEG